MHKRKATDECLIQTYNETKSVWKVGRIVGMCGQSVHERLTKLGVIEGAKYNATEIEFMNNNYVTYRNMGELDKLSLIMNRPKTSICRQARAMGLTYQNIKHVWSKKHGLSTERLYIRWRSMLARCYNKKHKQYSCYGGRGIKVCNEWLSTPYEFISWAESNGYKSYLTLDRIDNNGNYTPENCRFTDYRTQARNRRNTIKTVFMGRECTLPEIAEKTGTKYCTVYKRYTRGIRGNLLGG